MRLGFLIIGTATALTLLAAGGNPAYGQTTAAADSMTLKGGQDGTVFENLTIEGEDRIRIVFDRPELLLELDPRTAPGLEWDNSLGVLERGSLDLDQPFLVASAKSEMMFMGRPWFNRFSTEGVARFHPNVEKVERWELVVADSRGQTVARFHGDRKPPKEIIWDGRSEDGTPVPPGLTYTYVFEAYDRAGNKRNFLGEGFTLPPYRLNSPSGTTMVFSGADLKETGAHALGNSAPPASVVLEAADWLNQHAGSVSPIQVRVTGRSFSEAQAMADQVVQALSKRVLGNPLRIQGTAQVQTDAPEMGTVEILTGGE